ncbi:MAG: GNAT family N-acetyltransferase [Candidatus Didemnitutus sp.]|nr:GNAT family N-acetyltransferase [Candidatus Didemnitutus sp.]
MAFTFPSLFDFGLEPAAQVLARGFSDYFVPIPATPAMLLGMVRGDSVDLTVSRVAVRDGQPVGAALIARRGWTSRLAGMAIVPEARRTGVGRALMDQLLAEARARGERAMVLEVIEQNAPAVQLYEACSFKKIRRLTGHAGRPETPQTDAAATAALEEIDPRALASLVAEHGLPDLPWQISAETIAQATSPALAFRLGPSALLLSSPAAETVALRAIVTERAHRGRGHSLALLRAVMTKFPGKEWRASAIFPEEMGETFTAAGLTRTPLSQWQMTRPLA